MRFCKKPIVVEAYRLEVGSIVPHWVERVSRRGSEPWSLVIPTLEGDMTARTGDWIIRGVKGEVYPCKPDIFEATYEAVD